MPALATSNRSASGRTVVLVLASSQPQATLSVAEIGYAVLITSHLVEALARLGNSSAAATCPLAQRELECLLHTLAGHSAKVTARALGVGERSVNQYLQRSRAKLGCTTSFAAAMAAARHGWIDPSHAEALKASAAGKRQAK